MPPSIDLQCFRDELEQLYFSEGYARQQLTHRLADRGLVVARRTIKRQLKDWASPDESLPTDDEDTIT